MICLVIQSVCASLSFSRAPSLRSLRVTSNLVLPDPGEFIDKVLAKLHMVDQVALTGGIARHETVSAFINHLPSLDVLWYRSS